GLLAEVRGDGSVYFPCYDANGNVTDYLDAYGTVRGHFEYDAFGNTVAMWGDLAHTFRFRFSTKYWDAETQSYYYGYRHYAPKLGCWLNRDPIEENGGNGLYGFVGNNPVNKTDTLGLMMRYLGTPCEPTGKQEWIDQQWKFTAYYPEATALGGSIGGSVSYALTFKYIRKFRREYICCCKDYVWESGLSGISIPAPPDEMFIFQGSPSPWPPVHFLSVMDFFMDAAGNVIPFPTAPIDITKNIINSYALALTPSNSENGNVIWEPRVPRRKCK
ncbi:MAG: RHS repeat-associated core domain-containing protein, partial [Kiritimatiellae bacterium]|nr:RHS repeat-associated core domain-containing protein [Kiritimatiellia bacterium]